MEIPAKKKHGKKDTKKDALNIMCKSNIRSFRQMEIPPKTTEENIPRTMR